METLDQTPEVGLVFGKFYPLTCGHQYLIEFARAHCRRLFVGISGRTSETIPQHTRAQWIRQLYPDVTVVEQPQTLPYYPHECRSEEEFYAIWTPALLEVCGGRSPDVLFTSEDYGPVTANYLRCRHFMVDRARTIISISATQIRKDPFAHWEFMHPIVRSHFVKVVCVNGPESTGKSTLCHNRAKHFNTIWQPEWARGYLGERHCIYEDMEVIAREHLKAHEQYRQRASKLLFMDTDAITTLIYSKHYYDKIPAAVSEAADLVPSLTDLYLLTEIDVPWIPDTTRDLGEPSQRQHIKKLFIEELEKRNISYIPISGGWTDRLQRAIDLVNFHMFSGATR